MKLSWHQGVIAKVEHKSCNLIEVITKISPKGFILGVKVKIKIVLYFLLFDSLMAPRL
jgi:hypothetical protein